MEETDVTWLVVSTLDGEADCDRVSYRHRVALQPAMISLIYWSVSGWWCLPLDGSLWSELVVTGEMVVYGLSWL